MQTYQYETIETLKEGPLLISVDADKYEIPMKSFVRECGAYIAIEEVQSKYNSDCKFEADREFNRAGFLYQALLSGNNLEEIKEKATQLIKDIRKLEKCLQKEVIDAR